MSASDQLAHVTNNFHFELQAPMPRVAPLFGPEEERASAGDHWNSIFLSPLPARDTPGAVFQVRRGAHTSTWVNTLFDLPGGRMQHVAFIDRVVVNTVDVTLHSLDASRTAVNFSYSRTALQRSANNYVRALGEADRNSGPEWQQSISKYLGASPK